MGDSTTGSPPAITRTNVSSTSLRSIGYSEELKILEVEFVSGEVYRFFMVPAAVHEALMSSKSKGAFFGDAVREKFPVTKVPVAGPEDLTAALEQSLAAMKPRE